MRSPHHALALALALLPCGTALAHGEQHHGSRPAQAVKEQKPWGVAGDAARVQRTKPTPASLK